MEKAKINAREAANDIKSGMTDAQLMSKHNLSEAGLQSLKSKLMAANLISSDQLNGRKRGDGRPAQPDKKALARGIARAVRDGLSDEDIAHKFSISPQKLPALFAALVQAKYLDQDEIDSLRRPSITKKDYAEALSPIVLAVLQDINDGRHDSELMRKHNLSPSGLREIRSTLQRAGRLAEQTEDAATKVCPSCGKRTEASSPKCLYCDRSFDANPGAEQMGIARTAVPRSEQPGMAAWEDVKECPWEQRENYGTVNAYFQTASKCLLQPTAFFSGLPVDGGYWNPILFGTFSPVVGFTIFSLFRMLLSGHFVGLIGLFIVVSISFGFLLIFIPIVMAIWAGMVHGTLCLLGGGNVSFQTTFRVIAYSSVPQVFNGIPVVGNLVSLWTLVLTVIGLRETHNVTTGKSVAAVLIPTGVLVFIGLLVWFSAYSRH
jgi:hypothetical protein